MANIASLYFPAFDVTIQVGDEIELTWNSSFVIKDIIKTLRTCPLSSCSFMRSGPNKVCLQAIISGEHGELDGQCLNSNITSVLIINPVLTIINKVVVV